MSNIHSIKKMKKLTFKIIALTILGCSSEGDTLKLQNNDTTSPVITINGAENMLVTQWNPYVEDGATAIDDVDGDLTYRIKVTGEVDTSIVGKYSINYSVADDAGNIGNALRSVNVVGIDLPMPINRALHLVENAWSAPIQKYFDFDSPFFSSVSFNYSSNQTRVWSDIVEMNFDGTYKNLNLTEKVFGAAQDSLNGLLFNVNRGANKLLVNFWGEGENEAWYYPNVLVLFDLNNDDYEIIYDSRGTDDSTFYNNVLFDLNNDNVLDIYLGGSGYIINKPSPERTKSEAGPGPVFIIDIDSDGKDDLLHFDTPNNTWIKYKGGGVLEKSTINSDYVFRNYIDDFLVTDYDGDGDFDLVFIDALTDGTNDGCEICIGKITVLQNDSGSLIDVTENIFEDSTYPQLFGDNNILADDYDDDGDEDLFFPDFYYHNGQLMNDFYWENSDGFFIKKHRNDLN
jgi:hypothetical protein